MHAEMYWLFERTETFSQKNNEETDEKLSKVRES